MRERPCALSKCPALRSGRNISAVQLPAWFLLIRVVKCWSRVVETLWNLPPWRYLEFIRRRHGAAWSKMDLLSLVGWTRNLQKCLSTYITEWRYALTLSQATLRWISSKINRMDFYAREQLHLIRKLIVEVNLPKWAKIQAAIPALAFNPIYLT